MGYLGIFEVSFENNYCHISNQHPQICQIAKFCKNKKLLKFGTKNALFGCFPCRNLNNDSHIRNQRSQVFKLQNFKQIQKHINLRPNMPYLDIFLVKLLKSIVIVEISTLKFV